MAAVLHVWREFMSTLAGFLCDSLIPSDDLPTSSRGNRDSSGTVPHHKFENAACLLQKFVNFHTGRLPLLFTATILKSVASVYGGFGGSFK